jgi:RimJ/RimL family protein N-acetyltransferase
MFIRSERLFLRPGWPEDWSELMARIGDAAVVRNFARSTWPHSIDSVRGFVSQDENRRCPMFVITVPSSEGSQLIGCAGLAPGSEGVELGYWIAHERRGQGYATEAARAVLSLARTLGHRRIVAGHFAEHPASGHVLHKLGFSPTGRIAQRFCVARGREVPTATYALAIDEPCGDDDMAKASRAA